MRYDDSNEIKHTAKWKMATMNYVSMIHQKSIITIKNKYTFSIKCETMLHTHPHASGCAHRMHQLSLELHTTLVITLTKQHYTRFII